MKKFKGKYRIETCRLKNWDYSSNASYFVTIVTKYRKHHFGKIIDKCMHLSAIGQIADKFWHEIPQHFPYVQLDAFIIMPDHIHGIITIADTDAQLGVSTEDTDAQLGVSTINSSLKNHAEDTDAQLGVSTINSSFKNSTEDQTPNWASTAKPAHLGTIINQYKRIVTINSRQIESKFAWHPRYYDHIIKTPKAYENISNYIKANPKNWKSK